jgi:hypothetical protein
MTSLPENIKKNSFTDFIINQCEHENTDVRKSIHNHAKAVLKELFECMESLYILDTENRKMIESIRHSLESEKKAGPVLMTGILADQKLWEQSINHVLNGDWNLRNQATLIQPYGLALTGFYLRLAKDNDTPIENILPILLKADRKVCVFSVWVGMFLGKGNNPIKKIIWAHNHANKIREKKHNSKDWKEMISVMLDLDENEKYTEDETLNAAIETTLFEMKTLKKIKKIKKYQSRDTIKRCFEQIFHFTAKNYEQPLKLHSRLKSY